MFCACMVFIMHLGFATLETGLTRAKNSINILFKNVAIVAIASVGYAIIGFNLMYPGDNWIVDGIIPSFTFGLNVPDNAFTPAYAAGYTYWTDFLFQAMFAAATASVVSGAVCERIKLNSFLIFCTICNSMAVTVRIGNSGIGVVDNKKVYLFLWLPEIADFLLFI